jgi:plasmid stability protein
MATLTIELDEVLLRRLRIRADANGRSMEDEAREIPHEALRDEPAGGSGTRGVSVFNPWS